MRHYCVRIVTIIATKKSDLLAVDLLCYPHHDGSCSTSDPTHSQHASTTDQRPLAGFPAVTTSPGNFSMAAQWTQLTGSKGNEKEGYETGSKGNESDLDLVACLKVVLHKDNESYLDLVACLQVVLHQLVASLHGRLLSGRHLISALAHCSCPSSQISRHRLTLPAVML